MLSNVNSCLAELYLNVCVIRCKAFHCVPKFAESVRAMALNVRALTRLQLGLIT